MKKIYYFFLNQFRSFVTSYKFVIYTRSIYKKKKNKILMEYYPYHESILAQSIVSNILKNKFDAEINLYKINNYWSFFKRFVFYIIKFLPFSKRNIYYFIGARKFIFPNKTIGNPLKTFNELSKKIKKKEDILKIKINKNIVGDLIYDGYLRYNYIETIDINKNFKNYLLNFIKIFLYWENYLKKNNVKAIICSHQIYEEGILNRLSLKYKIECYQTSLNYIFKTDTKNKSFLESWFNYKKEFQKLPEKYKKIAISRAKKNLNKNILYKGQIKKTKKNKIKILIAAHCIYDAPHAFGKFNFIDMGEWLNFLLKFSKEKNYEWVLKIHPNCYDCDIEIVKRILKYYPNIKILPKEMDHKKIIRDGITHVLSVYGTIGYEYSNLNIPVILASQNNPYKSFNFLTKCKSKNEFKNSLDKINKVKSNFNKSELYEYYYMRFLHHFNILYNYEKYKNEKKNMQNQAYVYDYFIKNMNNKNQLKILKDLEDKIFKNISGNYSN